MTPEQIQQWAREAGFHAWYSDPYRDYHFGCIQAFATLVRQHALEEAAKAVDKLANDKKATQQQQFALDIASDKIRELKS